MRNTIGDLILKVAISIVLVAAAIGVVLYVRNDKSTDGGKPEISITIPPEVANWKKEILDANKARDLAFEEARKSKKMAADADALAEAAQKAHQKIQADQNASAEEKNKALQEAQAAGAAMDQAMHDAEAATAAAMLAANAANKKAEEAAQAYQQEMAKLSAETQEKLQTMADKYADDLATQNNQPPPVDNTNQSANPIIDLAVAVLQTFLGGFGTGTEYQNAVKDVASTLLKNQVPTETQVDAMLNAVLSPEDQLNVLKGIERALEFRSGMTTEAKDQLRMVIEKKKQEIKARSGKDKANKELSAFLVKYPNQEAFAGDKDLATKALRGIQTSNFGPGASGTEDVKKLLSDKTDIASSYKQFLGEALSL